MALETHPKGSEGVYEDNLPWVAGVEVETKKAKRYEFFCFEKENIRGPTRFEVRAATVPWQQRQKACWVF